MKKTIFIELVLIGFILFTSCEKEITLIESNAVLTQYDSLAISTNPVGAKVYIDGRNSGYTTPCKIKWLEIRDIQVTLKYSPYWDKEMTIKSDSINKPYFYDFLADDRNFGGIDCITDPEGANIYLDGLKLDAKTPFTMNRLRPGDYKIRYELYNFRADSGLVSVYGRNNDANYRNSVIKIVLKDTSQFVEYTRETEIWNCTQIYIDNTQKPWFISPSKGIYRLQENLFKKINNGLNVYDFASILQDSKGNTWFVAPGLKKVSPGGEIFDFGYLFRWYNINSICEDTRENIWVATKSGLLRCNLNSPMEKQDWEKFTANSDGLLGNNVNYITALSNGSVWATVWGAGVMKYQNGRWINFTSLNSPIPDVRIINMYSPNGEDIYFSSYSKLFSYSKGIWRYLTDIVSSVNKEIFVDSEKNIFIPLGSAIAIYKKDGTLSYISTKVKGYPTYFDAKSIGVDGDKNVWIATSNYGIIRFKYFNK